MVARKQEQQAKGKQAREIKEENAQNRMAELARSVAVSTATELAKGDAIVSGVRTLIQNNLAQAFGGRSLTSGQ